LERIALALIFADKELGIALETRYGASPSFSNRKFNEFLINSPESEVVGQHNSFVGFSVTTFTLTRSAGMEVVELGEKRNIIFLLLRSCCSGTLALEAADFVL
jgi:hypothetical protein